MAIAVELFHSGTGDERTRDSSRASRLFQVTVDNEWDDPTAVFLDSTKTFRRDGTVSTLVILGARHPHANFANMVVTGYSKGERVSAYVWHSEVLYLDASELGDVRWLVSFESSEQSENIHVDIPPQQVFGQPQTRTQPLPFGSYVYETTLDANALYQANWNATTDVKLNRTEKVFNSDFAAFRSSQRFTCRRLLPLLSLKTAIIPLCGFCEAVNDRNFMYFPAGTVRFATFHADPAPAGMGAIGGRTPSIVSGSPQYQMGLEFAINMNGWSPVELNETYQDESKNEAQVYFNTLTGSAVTRSRYPYRMKNLADIFTKTLGSNIGVLTNQMPVLNFSEPT